MHQHDGVARIVEIAVAMPVRAIPAASSIRGADIRAIAERTAAEGGTDVERVHRFRERVRAAVGGMVPASAREAYVDALGRLGLEATVRAARSEIGWLDVELARVETETRQSYEATRAHFETMQRQLAAVFADRRVSSEDRVGTFFHIAGNNERRVRLENAWRKYEANQAELRTKLADLRRVETSVGAGAVDDPRLVLFAHRAQGLESMLTSLEEQVVLLKTMLARAAGMGAALDGVRGAIERSIEQTRAWIERAHGDSVGQVLAGVLGVASMVGHLVLPAGAAPIVSLIRSALLEDVEGLRESAEAFVWRTITKQVTGGLVEVGVGRAAAKALVAALRAAAHHSLDDERDRATALVDVAVRASLSAAQRYVIDELLSRTDETLPVAALVRGVLTLRDLTESDARGLVRSFEGSGLDAALAVMEAGAVA